MEKIEIVLADQDRSYLDDAQRILRLYDEGYTLHSVTSLQECLQKISSNSIQLLLLDSHLSNGDCLTILDEVSNSRPDLPVILMVDEGLDDLAIEALERGAFDYIMKSKGYLTTMPFTVRKAIKEAAQNAEADENSSQEGLSEESSALFAVDEEVSKPLKPLAQEPESTVKQDSASGTMDSEALFASTSQDAPEEPAEIPEVKKTPSAESIFAAQEENAGQEVEGEVPSKTEKPADMGSESLFGAKPTPEPEEPEPAKIDMDTETDTDTDTSASQEIFSAQKLEEIKASTPATGEQDSTDDTSLFGAPPKKDATPATGEPKSTDDTSLFGTPAKEAEAGPTRSLYSLEKEEKESESTTEPKMEPVAQDSSSEQVEEEQPAHHEDRQTGHYQPPKDAEQIAAQAKEVIFGAADEDVSAARTEPESKKIPQLPLEATPRQPIAPQDAMETLTGSLVLDQKLRILSVNKQVEFFTGYSEDELLELALTDILLPENEDAFFTWLENVEKEKRSFTCELTGKKGKHVIVNFDASTFREGQGQLAGYRFRITEVEKEAKKKVDTEKVDQVSMIDDLSGIISSCYNKPLMYILDRIARQACQAFRFKRSTIALLDRRRGVYVKQAMIGYKSSTINKRRSTEVSAEVIERIFAKRYKIKVLYYNKELRDSSNTIGPLISERRTQERRAEGEWDRRDLILLNLMDSEHHTFGYISLNDPIEGFIPSRDTFFNLELFGRLASLIIENYWHFSSIERRSRRLKQVLVTSNIFKLYLSLSELLKEVVWSVKFSLDFNLVGLALISKKTGMLEMKAVACEDKIKMLQLREMTFDLDSVSDLLKEKYRRDRSYFIDQEETALVPLKNIWHPSNMNGHSEGSWPYWGIIFVPLKSRSGKIIGFLIVDDPVDYRVPSIEIIRTLEILANQVAVAIDNRVLYIQAKRQLFEATGIGEEYSQAAADEAGGGFRKLMDRLFH